MVVSVCMGVYVCVCICVCAFVCYDCVCMLLGLLLFFYVIAGSSCLEWCCSAVAARPGLSTAGTARTSISATSSACASLSTTGLRWKCCSTKLRGLDQTVGQCMHDANNFKSTFYCSPFLITGLLCKLVTDELFMTCIVCARHATCGWVGVLLILSSTLKFKFVHNGCVPGTLRFPLCYYVSDSVFLYACHILP